VPKASREPGRTARRANVWECFDRSLSDGPRVQRIAEEHQARNALLAAACHLGSNASSHRLPPITTSAAGVINEIFRCDSLDDGAIAVFELIVPVGQPPALFR